MGHGADLRIHYLGEKILVVRSRVVARNGIVGQLSGVIRLRGKMESADADMAGRYAYHNAGRLHVPALNGPSGGNNRQRPGGGNPQGMHSLRD